MKAAAPSHFKGYTTQVSNTHPFKGAIVQSKEQGVRESN